MNKHITLHGQVTQAQIDEGKACDCEHCPYALALLASGNVERTWAGSEKLWVRVMGQWYACETPLDIKHWMSAFDYKGKPIELPEPFTLEFAPGRKGNQMLSWLERQLP